MTRQVIDITSNGNTPDVLPNTKKVKKEKKPRKKKKLSFNIYYAILALILIVVIAVLVLSFQSKLVLSLSPVLEEVSLKEEVEVSITQASLDFENKAIPGKFFEAEEEKWNTFQSTGSTEEGGKSSGFITVYNSHEPARSVTLIPQTRFLSSKEGKTFRVTERVILPPAVTQGGKLVPSSAKVKVVAQEAGPAYNIPSSNFSVPGLSGTALYYSVWAESDTAMTGGFESEVKIVTKDDLEKAQESLKEGLENTAREALKRTVPDTHSVETGSVLFEDFQSSCFQEEGAEALEFNCYAKVKAIGLGFEKEDLKELARKFISLKVPVSKELSENSLNFGFSAKGSVSKAGSIVMDVDVQAKVFETINEELFISQVLGKKKQEIKDMIEQNYPQIRGVTMKFWPFWINKSPKSEEKINVELIH